MSRADFEASETVERQRTGEHLMRILQLHTRYRDSGGEDVVVDAEARALVEMGHDVHQVIRVNPSGSAAASANLLLSPWNPLSKREASASVKSFDPDITHVHNTWYSMSPSVIRAMKDAGLPVVMTLHNYRLTCANALLFRDGKPCQLCVGSHPWHAVRYACYRDSRAQSVPAAATIDLHRRIGTWAESVDAFLALTQFQGDLMVRAGLPKDKVVIKPNFVPDPGLRTRPPSSSDTVLFVGRLALEKGVGLLVDAWRQASPQGLELVIVGDGPLRSEIEANLPDNVSLRGALQSTEVQHLMKTSRASILSSPAYEGSPMVLLEAMAAGLPTIASDAGSAAGLVRESTGADWLFESGNVDSLAAKIDRLVDGRACDAASIDARAAYDENYQVEGVTQRLVDIYESLINRITK